MAKKKDVKEVQFDSLIVKSNKLIEAKYTLKLREQKILLYLISKIRMEDKDFKMYTLPIREFCEMMGMKGNPRYKDIKDATDGLQSKLLKIHKDNKIYSVSWLSLVVYNEREGTINMRFDPFLKPYLVQLTSEFTKYSLDTIIKMRSIYSIRLYEVLKQYLFVGTREIQISQIRDFFGLEESEYQRYPNLKQKAISVAVDEINKNSDILVSFTENKVGRKVDSLSFKIESKVIDPTPLFEDSTEQDTLISLFKDYNESLNEKTCQRWFLMANRIWDLNRKEELQDICIKSLNKTNIRNAVAFVTYILSEKVKLINEGKDHSLVFVDDSPNVSRETIRTEKLPKWFTDPEEEEENLDEDAEFQRQKRELEKSIRNRKEPVS